MSRYRLYVDESGDHVLGDGVSLNQRYLGLTGVIFDNEHYRSVVHPELEALKQKFFPHNPDDPVVLVRNQIVRKVGSFKVLQDQELCSQWENAIIEFFRTHIRRIFTVVVDKQSHFERYGEATKPPYDYCFTVLLERYRGWLRAVSGRGDVMVESRNGPLDTELKNLYSEVYGTGTGYLSGQQFKDYFTTKELKLQKKQANIAGLQIADLLAYPSKIDILLSHRQNLPNTPSQSTIRIADAVRGKYNRYGRVFLN